MLAGVEDEQPSLSASLGLDVAGLSAPKNHLLRGNCQSIMAALPLQTGSGLRVIDKPTIVSNLGRCLWLP